MTLSTRESPERICALTMAAFRRNTLCIARKDDEVRVQRIREAPKLMGSAFAQGRYQVQKRITQQRYMRVIFGLMPAFVFISFAKKMNRVLNAKLKKAAHGITVSISEQDSP